jgi:signal transduction histidine kinase
MNNACYTVWYKSQETGSDYQPAISVKVSADADNITITIEDNGQGMSEEVKKRLYENFFTTKPVGQGTGLGMAITKDIVENKHHGQLSFDSQEGQGTTFYITIPLKKA